jgi:NADH dehydrogenase
MAEHAIIESGIPYTIFRPSWVYGREDKSLNRFVRFAQTLPFVPVIGDGKNRVQPLFIMDLVRMIARSLELPKTMNQIYEIGGPEILTMDEVVRTILTVLEKHKPIVHHPVWFMKMAAAPMRVLRAPPLSPGMVDFVTMEELVDNTRALEDFQAHLTPLGEALATYLSSSRSAA